MDDHDKYRAPALDKGLDILELLSTQERGLTRAEIVKLLGRNASEIYRMLERLVARDYVARSESGDRYALTLKLYSLAHQQPPIRRFIDAAQPIMDRFVQHAEQSCHLGVYDRGNILVIAQRDGPGPWGLSIRLGSRMSLLDTGSGSVMLAFQTDAQRERMLAEHVAVDGETPIGADALRATLAQVRADRHHSTASRQAYGVTDISCPVYAPDGTALAVITSPYIRRIDLHAAASPAQVLELLQHAAAELSMSDAARMPPG
ncbi:IclR family transcriptional regulator [Pararobbsia silviterrae]|uniref:IclR family transcriptional regulator n=1 Tax=Pararobbsia silviterrae TaxID=1792498 RepID=UPI001F0C6C2E|nr:IclR family transcriptional regulator [Pararobbsia silviterrae]